MKATYLGQEELAHKVRKLYIGVDDVAHKVKRAYIGVDGVARLFFTSDFFIPKGISMSDVLCAYQFAGESVKSWDIARKDLSDSQLDLNRVPSWSQQSGLTGNYTIVNADPRQIRSFVIKYKNNQGGHLIVSEENSWDLWFGGRIDASNGNLINTSNLFFWSDHYWVDWANADAIHFPRCSTVAPINGIVGISSNTLYINGEYRDVFANPGGYAGISFAENFTNVWRGTHVPLGLSMNNYSIFNINAIANIEAIAFFKVVLTSEQQYEIYRNLSDLK